MTLAWHVDYWDYLGWKDPFASKLWTDRQRACVKAIKSKQTYTPMLVAGGTHSSNIQAITQAAEKALAEEQSISLALTAKLAGGKLTLNVTTKKLKDLPAGTKLYAAIAEDGIATKCTSGENSGRELHEGSVARALCEPKDVAERVSWTVAVDAKWNVGKLRAIVFAQDAANWQVFEATQTIVPKK